MSKKYDPKAPCWGKLCQVDPSALVRWLDAGKANWRPVKGMQPNLAYDLPDEAQPIIREVCKFLGAGVTDFNAVMSRLVPGVEYEFHSDGQPGNWITRVHVPVLTSDKAWFSWEEQGGEKVYMEYGWAYSFNTIKRHNYANYGDTDRVHLMFDALQGQA